MKKAVLFFAVLVAAIPCVARIITVDDDGPADFNNIQAAIDDANKQDTVEIQSGRYTGPGNRDINFKGKVITVRSTDPNDPNVVAATIIDCNEIPHAFIFTSRERPFSVLAGLTIINAFSSTRDSAIYCRNAGPTIKNCTIAPNSEKSGIAISCDHGSPIISGCSFANNATQMGSSLYYGYSSSTITECVFSDNIGGTYSETGAILSYNSNLTIAHSTFRGDFGLRETIGGTVVVFDSEISVKDCLFLGCSNYSGSALKSCRSRVSLANCVFAHNSALRSGGALAATLGGNLALTNCLFTGNCASISGGALSTSYGAEMTLVNCTFAGNRAPIGNTLGFLPTIIGPSKVHIENSILWDGGNCIANHDGSTVTLSFCDISGGPDSLYDPCNAVVWGPGNVDIDPCFAEPGYWDANGTPEDANDDYWVSGDYHLMSQAGRRDANEGRWAIDDVTSPCIDAGDPLDPIGQEPFPNGGRINMGAYGGAREASKSYFGAPVCETIVAGDINGDCIVDFRDLSTTLMHWLEDNTPPAAPQIPGQATGPDPPDGAVGIDPRSLSWTPGPGATSHDVYFGTANPPEFQINRIEPTFYPRALPEETMHYWRIDEVSQGKTTTGAVWSFTTGSGTTR
jgi:predicted outer membrane repeat protein